MKIIRKSKGQTGKRLDICMFLAVFLGSMSGTLICGISIGKVGLIPLVAYMVMRQGVSRYICVPFKSPLLLYYVFGMLSCVFALTHISRYQHVGYVEDMVFFVLQHLIFYIPLLVLVYNDNNKYELRDSFYRMLVLTCRIQMVFGLVELVTYSAFQFDIGKYISTNYMDRVLTVEGTRGWSSIGYSDEGMAIRPGGFTNDANFLAILLTMGFVLDKNKVFKLLYVAMVFLSSTRSSLVVLLLILLIYAIEFFRNRTHSVKKIFIGSVFVLGSIVGIIYIFETNIFVQKQVIALLSRFDFLSRNLSQLSFSSRAHIMYYPYGLKVYIEDLNILEKLIGSGPRASGLMLQLNPEVSAALDLHVHVSWGLECDVMGTLIGHGLIGFILYYATLYHLFKNNRENAMAILVVALTGVFYCITGLTFVALMYIIFSAAPESGPEQLSVKTIDLNQVV